MKESLLALPELAAAHMGLTLAALFLGILTSVPLGILTARSKRYEALVLGAASVIQTIPGLALLAFMVPALAALGARSIGYLPALIGLYLYSLLPILRNTVEGISGIDPAIIEAARGVGMSPREQLRRVELPLALPVIVAGIRTSAVWTVGTATLATPVGAQSLGSLIFSGLQTRNYTTVLVGCAASAVLSLVLDGLLWGLFQGIVKRSRPIVMACSAFFVLMASLAVLPWFVRLSSGAQAPVVVGAKTFTEQYILAHILSGQIERETGVAVQTMESLGSTVVFDALKANQIDAYVDYSGTLWTAVLGRKEPGKDRAALLREVERELLSRHHILVVAALGFENTYALAMRRADAERLSIKKLSDLAPHTPRLSIGGDYEIFGRAEWKSLKSIYGFSFSEQRSMDPSLMYEAAQSAQVSAITAFSTDGRIAAYDLVVLEDDRAAIPPYDAVILVSESLAQRRPGAVDALRHLAGKIDAARMREMNAAVDERKESPARVAQKFLQSIR